MALENNSGNGNNQNSGCVCNCLHLRHFDADFFDTYRADPALLELWDKFPPDQCDNAIGILTMNDATVYCKFDVTMGWVMETYAHGGKVI